MRKQVLFVTCLVSNSLFGFATNIYGERLGAKRNCHLYSGFRGGGGGYYEPNPNYVPKPKSYTANNQAYSSEYNNKPLTLGDLEKVAGEVTVSLPPGVGAATRYIRTLHGSNFPLSVTAWGSVLVFCLWQLCHLPYPLFQRELLSFLQRYFVCSRGNVHHVWRLPSVVLCAMSHMNFAHLVVNLYAFLRFGPDIFTVLNIRANRQKFLLLLGSALSGSLSYLLFDRNGAGCLGLSSVTFTFIALYSQLFPQRILRLLLVGIIPVRMTAQQLLFGGLLWSTIGTLMSYIGSRPSSNTAHSAHLGGLIYGLAYYKLHK
jgi:membrane associated rhomboid family serine protease